jgi:hypothetical protein
VESTRDNVCLLLGSKLNEVYCISGYADSELGIILGMLLSIEKSFSVENVYIKMVTTLGSITIEKIHKVTNLCGRCFCHDFFLLVRFVY